MLTYAVQTINGKHLHRMPQPIVIAVMPPCRAIVRTTMPAATMLVPEKQMVMRVLVMMMMMMVVTMQMMMPLKVPFTTKCFH
jgi:hypothetical protein